MPTIDESELKQDWDSNPCTNCPDYEGAIWLCGEGYLCESCFSELAGIDEEDVYISNKSGDFEVADENRARVKASLTYQRSAGAEGEV